MNGDWFNLTSGSASIVGLVLAVAGILLAIYLFRRSNNLKSLAYTYKTVQFIDSMPADKRLRLTFDDQEISKVSLTKIAVWNNSNNVIHEDDFARVKPFVITIEESELELDTYKLYGAEETNNLRFLKLEDKSIRPLFDYLGPQDGFILTILHQGDTKTRFGAEGVFKNKLHHKIKRKELIDNVGDLIFVSFVDPKSGVTAKVGISIQPIKDIDRILNQAITKLFRRLTKEPIWLDKYRSDDWSIGEENIIDWIQ